MSNATRALGVMVQQSQKGCREFIVLPPNGDEFDAPGMHDRIRRALASRFPAYEWHLMPHGRHREECFVFLPVLGVAGGAPWEISMIERPDIEDLQEIADFLFQEFVGFNTSSH